jgi:hypothetical protein
MTVFIAMLIIALGVVDIWITGQVLKAGGTEQNILMKRLQDILPFSWEPIKALCHVAVAVAVLKLPFMLYGGMLFALAYIGIIAWNAYILRKLVV